jgi:transketolase
MSNDPGPLSPVFSINVSADAGNANAAPREGAPLPKERVDIGMTLVALTRQMLEMQNRQNQVMEQLLQVSKQVLQNTTQANAQRQNELNQWRNAHPELVQSCRSALETLSSVQTEFLQKMADEVEASKDELSESEYMFSDFLDRYGPRMAHLNGVLQVLNHLCG